MAKNLENHETAFVMSKGKCGRDGTQQIQSLIVARQILGLKRDQLK